MKSDDQQCYILTIKNSEGDTHIYSLRDDDVEPEILIFENEDDAERYVQMLERDEEYLIGDTMQMVVSEVNFNNVLEILKVKERSYILVKKDELFIPPPTDQ